MATDVKLVGGETNPADVRLANPVVGSPVTINAGALVVTSSLVAAAVGRSRSESEWTDASSIVATAVGRAKTEAEWTDASAIVARAVGRAASDAHLTDASSIVARGVGRAASDGHIVSTSSESAAGQGRARTEAELLATSLISARPSSGADFNAPGLVGASSMSASASGAAEAEAEWTDQSQLSALAGPELDPPKESAPGSGAGAWEKPTRTRKGFGGLTEIYDNQVQPPEPLRIAATVPGAFAAQATLAPASVSGAANAGGGFTVFSSSSQMAQIIPIGRARIAAQIRAQGRLSGQAGARAGAGGGFTSSSAMSGSAEGRFNDDNDLAAAILLLVGT